jgi:hypothetical protein
MNTNNIVYDPQPNKAQTSYWNILDYLYNLKGYVTDMVPAYGDTALLAAAVGKVTALRFWVGVARPDALVIAVADDIARVLLKNGFGIEAPSFGLLLDQVLSAIFVSVGLYIGGKTGLLNNLKVLACGFTVVLLNLVVGFGDSNKPI